MQAAAEYAVQGVASPASLEVALKALHFLGKDSPEKAQQWTAMETDACRKAYAQASAPPFKHRAATLLVSRLAKTAEADGTAGHWARSEETLREAVGVGAALSLQNTLLIRARHARAKVLAPADKKAQNLADALKSQPDNVTARMDLLRLLVVELDAPAEAARHLGGAFDEVWRTYVPMAAQPVKELNETACWELGQWYYKALLKLAETPEARLSVLRRAKTYYERFSELHAAQDAQTAGVKVALTAIREELDAAKDSPVGTIVPGQWIPLMPEAHRLVGWNVPQELKPGEKVLYDGYTLELASTEGLVVDFPLDARDVVLRAVVRLMQSGTLQLRVRTGQKGAFFGEFFGGNSFQLTWWNSDTQEREVLAEKQTLRTYKSSFELMLVATGTTLALYADGEKVLQVQDKRRVSGSVGLKVVDGRAQFEDVMILIPDKGWKLK